MIDSHHHLWNYSKAEYPWIPESSHLAKDHLVPQLEAVTTESGVTGTVAVQARQTIEESDWLLSLTNQTDIIKGVVGWVPLRDRNVFAEISRLKQWDKFKGIRHVLQDEPDDFFLDKQFNHGLTRVAKAELSYDLLIFQRQLPIATQMIDAHPDLGIILDHIAKPEAQNGRIEKAWRDGMRELAKRDHVLGVKFSGLLTEFSKASGDEETVRAYFEETLNIFGVERVLFGTDWPVSLLKTNYPKWTEQVLSLCSELSAHEQTAVMSENTQRCYRLD